jgi:hypothetical protein
MKMFLIDAFLGLVVFAALLWIMVHLPEPRKPPPPECTRNAWSAYGYAGYVDPYTAAQRTRERGAKC